MAQPAARAPVYFGSVSPQGLELLRRRTRVTVSPPETWVPNLGAGDEAQLGHGQQHLVGRRVGLGSGREEGPAVVCLHPAVTGTLGWRPSS